MKRRQFAVIGLGRFGAAVATTLSEIGHEVLGVDAEEDSVRGLADTVDQVLQLDATDIKALRSAGVQNFETAIVSIGENIEASLLVVMLLKDLGVPTIVAKAVTPLHGRILEKLGVSRVIFPERDVAVRLAHSLSSPNMLDYIGLSRDFSIAEIPAPASFVGRSLRELELRPRFGLTLIAIKRGEGAAETTVAPGADEVVRAGDVLALLGRNDRLERIDELMK